LRSQQEDYFYDFALITGLTVNLTKVRFSGTPDFPGVTGGEYRARERIHRGLADPRLLAIPASWGRVAALNPNWDRLLGISSGLRLGNPLYRPLYHACSPGHQRDTRIWRHPHLPPTIRGQSPVTDLTQDKGFALCPI